MLISSAYVNALRIIIDLVYTCMYAEHGLDVVVLYLLQCLKKGDLLKVHNCVFEIQYALLFKMEPQASEFL